MNIYHLYPLVVKISINYIHYSSDKPDSQTAVLSGTTVHRHDPAPVGTVSVKIPESHRSAQHVLPQKAVSLANSLQLPFELVRLLGPGASKISKSK